MWPIQGLPIFLQYTGYVFPFAFATSAFRNILMKDSSLFDDDVYKAFIVLLTWITALTCLCFWFIRDKNETKSKKKVKA